MSVFMQAMKTNDARTANGAVTHSTSGSDCLNWFFTAGALRGKPRVATEMFKDACYEDLELAVRILLWSRDVRGGAGERENFRVILKDLSCQGEDGARLARAVTQKVPEIGRWDDLVALFDTPLEDDAIALWVNAIINERNALAAKWMPRERSKNAHVFRKVAKALDITPKQLRKILVKLSDTVEQKISWGDWDGIDFGKLPSVASARYQRCFGRHAQALYTKYISALQKGTAKINAGAVYPYDVVKSVINGNRAVANEQWKALPNYMEGSDERIMPVVDVSGSMDVGINGGGYVGRSGVTAMDVAISLGIYVAERSEGAFHNEFISFSSDPHFHSLRENASLYDNYIKVKGSGENMSTNISKCFEVLLQRARQAGLTNEQMPTKLLIMSDMEFDAADSGGGYYSRGATTNFVAIRNMYETAGYQMPQLVFWNIAGRAGNVPVKMNDQGVALVSGCSPSILTSLLDGTLDPVSIMLKTVNVERYSF